MFVVVRRPAMKLAIWVALAHSSVWAISSDLPVMHRLEIRGNTVFSEAQIKKWFGVQEGEPVSLQNMRPQLLNLLTELNKQGFIFASIDSVTFAYSPDSSQVELSIKVEEGDRAKFASLRVTDSAPEAGEIANDFRSQAGKRFRSGILEDDIELIIQRHEQNGYPFCRVTVAAFDLEPLQNGETGLAVGLRVEPGPQVRIDEISVRGSDQTREFVILRELPLRLGDIYDQREIDRIQSKLMRLGFFKWVNPPVLVQLDDGRYRLLIELAEGNHNQFDGVLGYNPASANQGSFITGLLDVRFGNLFGTARQIDAHWERRTQETQDLSLKYTEPWLAGRPVNLGLGFEQLIQDTSYVNRRLAVDLTFLFNDNLSFASRFSRSDVSPDSLGALRLGIPPSRSLTFGLGVAFNTTDDILNPQHGVKYETAVEWTKKTLEGEGSSATATPADQSFNQRRLTIDFENYFRLFRWQVLALALHGRETRSAEEVVQITEQYRLGGTRTLRGYREEQFRGSRIAWANFEYRYLLGPRSRMFLFTDLGYFFREEQQVGGGLRRIDGLRVGYGFGLRFDTRLGFFGIDYGLGENDGFSEGKIHIRLINEF